MSAVGGLTNGPSHAEGGIKMKVADTQQVVELEGGEAVINKKNIASDKKLRITGTPKQIASAINELDGNGVKIADGAKVEKLKRGGQIGSIKSISKDIQKIEHLVDYSVRGNSHQIPYDAKMLNDWEVFLNDKQFFEKYGDKIGTHPDSDEFDEEGRMEEFRITDQYYITFKDGSELVLDFSVPDYTLQEAYVSDDQTEDSMAKKYQPEFEKDGWDMSINEIEEQINKMEKGGEVSGSTWCPFETIFLFKL